MALMKYKDVLVLAKDKVKEVMAPLRARETRKKGELELAKLESDVAEKEQVVQEVASAYPLDFYKLLEALDNLALKKRQKEQLEDVLKELFDDAE